jgi:hypothetical protein
MSFTLAELFLLGWGCVASMMYANARTKLAFHRTMMMQMVEGFADKKVEAYRDHNGNTQVRMTNNVR